MRKAWSASRRYLSCRAAREELKRKPTPSKAFAGGFILGAHSFDGNTNITEMRIPVGFKTAFKFDNLNLSVNLGGYYYPRIGLSHGYTHHVLAGNVGVNWLFLDTEHVQLSAFADSIARTQLSDGENSFNIVLPLDYSHILRIVP